MKTAVDVKVRQGNCFRLLAACFYEPEKELFLQESLCDNLASLLAASGCKAEAKAADRMKQVLEGGNDEDLKVEHARLFVGPFELVAPPYGSVYLEENRMLMGNSTLAVQKMYQENGLALEVREAPDHIALELEFLHFLCMGEADAAARDDQDVALALAATRFRFLLNYLAPWVPAFCAAIREGSDNGFYTSLADCLEGFIAAVASRSTVTNILTQSEDTHACRAAV